MTRARSLVLTAVAAAGLWTAIVSAQQAKPAWTAAYTEAQATRGDALFQENCSACHGVDFAGTDIAPSLSGASFVAKWSPQPASALFELTRATMPLNMPAGFSRTQYADMVTAILKKNGVAAGKTELSFGADPAPAAPVASAAPTVLRPVTAEETFTVEQAARGKVYFTRNCMLCHTASLTPILRTDIPANRGYWQNTGRMNLPLGTKYLSKYPSVYHVFRRIRDSMPPWNPPSVGIDQKVDIVAYLLQQNGYPAGSTPLRLDTNEMKTISLNEQGFVRVFNGKNFDGIKFMLGMNCKPKPAGCGSTEPGSTFWVDPIKREIGTTGQISGYWYTEQRYLNFTLRFDYRFERPADLDPDDEYYDGNSGYMLFVTEHQVWPRMIEVQGNNINPMSTGGGQGAKVKFDRELRDRVKRKVGEWHSAEISNKDGVLKTWLNGVQVVEVTGHQYKEAGHIGFQSEGVPVHWRNIRIRVD